MDAATALNKWKARAGGAAGDWASALTTTSKDPLALAAAKADLWQTQVSSDRSKTRFKSGLGKVTRAEFNSKVNSKGVPAYGIGISNGATRMGAFLNAWLPKIQQTVQQLDASNPRGTKAQNRARQRAFESIIDADTTDYRQR